MKQGPSAADIAARQVALDKIYQKYTKKEHDDFLKIAKLFIAGDKVKARQLKKQLGKARLNEYRADLKKAHISLATFVQSESEKMFKKNVNSTAKIQATHSEKVDIKAISLEEIYEKYTKKEHDDFLKIAKLFIAGDKVKARQLKRQLGEDRLNAYRADLKKAHISLAAFVENEKSPKKEAKPITKKQSAHSTDTTNRMNSLDKIYEKYTKKEHDDFLKIAKLFIAGDKVKAQQLKRQLGEDRLNAYRADLKKAHISLATFVQSESEQMLKRNAKPIAKSKAIPKKNITTKRISLDGISEKYTKKEHDDFREISNLLLSGDKKGARQRMRKLSYEEKIRLREYKADTKETGLTFPEFIEHINQMKKIDDEIEALTQQEIYLEKYIAKQQKKEAMLIDQLAVQLADSLLDYTLPTKKTRRRY